MLAFHEGLPLVPGGFLGVDVFFVLSGFLITDLLAGQVRPGRQHRAALVHQRLGARPGDSRQPLALTLLTVTAAVSLLNGQRGGLRPALLGRDHLHE